MRWGELKLGLGGERWRTDELGVSEGQRRIEIPQKILETRKQKILKSWGSEFFERFHCFERRRPDAL
jgi:hypothetical protein